jgi:hypothetical protein
MSGRDARQVAIAARDYGLFAFSFPARDRSSAAKLQLQLTLFLSAW